MPTMWCWVTGDFCAYCNTQQMVVEIHRAQHLHTQKNIGTETMYTDQNAKLIEGYKQQIQK